MAHKPFSSETVVDGFASMEAGVNSGIAPLLLQPNQLAFGKLARSRCFRNILSTPPIRFGAALSSELRAH